MLYGWSPQIGDPSMLGWVTVFAYFATGILCLCASRRDAGAARHWLALSLALCVLGINKQLDLQTLLTQVGRAISHEEGWYERRAIAQFAFVLGFVAVALAISFSAWRRLRIHSGQVRLASAGFALLIVFICVRAASIHHVDRFLKSTLFGARFNWILELGGIAIVAIAAAGAIRRPPRSS